HSIDLIVVCLVIYLYPNSIIAFFVAAVVTKVIGSVAINSATFVEINGLLKGVQSARISLLRTDWKPVVAFAFSVSGTATLNKVKGQADKLILGIVSGFHQV